MGLRLAGGIELPTRANDIKFCQRWLVHKDHNRAGKESGMAATSLNKGNGKTKLLRFLPYLSNELQKREHAVATQFALDQKDIINEMIAIGFANAQDYVKTEELPSTNGHTIKRQVQKPLMELTRAQASAISSVTFSPDGKVTYTIPDEKSKHPYLKDLGQHLGLFHPKLIQEHRHAHLHRMLDFKGLDTERLAKFEADLIDAMGEEAKRVLGIVEGEFEEADPGS